MLLFLSICEFHLKKFLKQLFRPLILMVILYQFMMHLQWIYSSHHYSVLVFSRSSLNMACE